MRIDEEVDQGEEEGLRDEGGEADLDPEDAPPLRPDVAEPRLKVATKEGLLGQADQQELRHDNRGELGREVELELSARAMPPLKSESEAREDQGGDAKGYARLAEAARCGPAERAPQIEEAEGALGALVVSRRRLEQACEVDAVPREAPGEALRHLDGR